MPIIRSINNIHPKIEEGVFIAENATIIGDVEIGSQSSIWYGTVLRGDVGKIKIGKRTSIQDLVMIHCTYHYSGTVVGDEVTVGHSAVLHGCEIHDRVLIGMGVIVLDKAVVQSDVIIGAGSVVLEKSVLASGFLYAGSPAKKIKPLTEAQLKGLKQSADHYVMYQDWYRENEKGSI